MYILATESCEFITNKYYHNNILINYRISKIINTSGKNIIENIIKILIISKPFRLYIVMMFPVIQFQLIIFNKC